MRAGRVPGPAVAACLVAALALAAPQRAAAASQGPAADLFGGYSYTHAGAADLHGWSLVGSRPFRGELSLVADLSGHYGSFGGADLGQVAFLAGVRWTGLPGRRLRPFAEGLVGVARTSTRLATSGVSASDADVDGGFAFGGGLDYRLSRRWSARGLVQLRLLRGEGATDEDARLSVGAAYRFGQ